MSKNEFMCDCNVIHQEIVDNTMEKMLEMSTFEDVATFFKVMGDTTRVRILFALDQNEMCVCDIANVLSMSKSSISHQLKTLKANGIVKCRKIGKEVFYSLDDEHVQQVFEVGIEHVTEKQN